MATQRLLTTVTTMGGTADLCACRFLHVLAAAKRCLFFRIEFLELAVTHQFFMTRRQQLPGLGALELA